MANVVGLIPAAGKGIRAYPYTEVLPKCLLEVDGVPLLRRNLELMRDQLGIRDVAIVIGHHGDRIREYLGDGEWLGIKPRFVENDDLERELAWSIYLGARRLRDDGLDGSCCVMLSDEFYQGTNHCDLLDAENSSAAITCALIESDSFRHVRKNYSVEMRDDTVVGLIEKPEDVTDRWMGVGTYWLRPAALDRLVRECETGDRSGPRDWTTWIDKVARSGVEVRALRLEGQYVNVNDREALNSANLVARNEGFERRSASLVYLVDDELPDWIGESIGRFADSDELDEVVVATRRRAKVLEEIARHPKVHLMVRDEPGIQLGTLLTDALDSAHGDILITSYSDSYSPRDLEKLLVYLRDADMVVGTRTTRQMIEQGSNMRGIVRAANVALAKLIEILWWRFDSRFTDVCCAYRAFWSSTYRTIRSELRSAEIDVFPELVIEVLRARRRIIEIPVNYYNRDHDQAHVTKRYQTVGTFLRFTWLILKKRFFTRPTRATGVVKTRAPDASRS